MDAGTAVLVVLFALIQFFFQFGANATKFVIPAEVFPTRFRATAHSISAACGRAGATLAAFVVNLLIADDDENETRLRIILAVFAVIQFVGLIATIFFLPETQGKDLDDFEHNDYERLIDGPSHTPINTEEPTET